MCDWAVSTSRATVSRTDAFRGENAQVAVTQPFIAGDTGVADPSVETRPHLEPARPVLRDERDVKAGQERVRHGHQPALGHQRSAPCLVGDPEPAGEHAPAQVELLDVVGHRHAVDVAPVARLDPPGQGLPVRAG